MEPNKDNAIRHFTNSRNTKAQHTHSRRIIVVVIETEIVLSRWVADSPAPATHYSLVL